MELTQDKSQPPASGTTVEHLWPTRYIHVLVMEQDGNWKRVPVKEEWVTHTAETLSKDFLTICLVVSAMTGDVLASYLRGERVI